MRISISAGDAAQVKIFPKINILRKALYAPFHCGVRHPDVAVLVVGRRSIIKLGRETATISFSNWRFVMHSGYCHLAQRERCQIFELRKGGISLREIVKDVGVHHSSVGRELNRNTRSRSNRYKQAQRKPSADGDRLRRFIETMTSMLWREVESRLKDRWSPD